MNNIFIIGPVASGKNTLLDNIVNNNEVIALDTGRIFRYVAYELTNKLVEEIDFTKISANDKNEINKLVDKIYHSTNFISEQLEQLSFDDNNFFKAGKKLDINFLYSKNVNLLLPIIAKISTIRTKIVKFIDDSISISDKPIIMTGHNIKEINTTKFTVVFLDVEEKESVYRLYNRNKKSYSSILDAYDEVLKRNLVDQINETRKILPFLYDYIYIDTNKKTSYEIYEEFIEKIKINKFKTERFYNIQDNSIERKNFNWNLNPILEPIRVKLQQLTQPIVDNYQYINQNDLIYQTLIHLSSYNIYELYSNCSEEYLKSVNDSIVYRNKKIYNDFLGKVHSDVIKVNHEIVLKSLLSSVLFLSNLYSTDEIRNIMVKYNQKKEKGKIVLHNGLMLLNNDDYTRNNKIIFKTIDSDMSKFLSKYCHYLHTPREDELVAYGAFVDDEKYPIAYASFSKQDRDYKKQLLFCLGIEPQNSVEMTRAWCSNSAPKNIMSLLFQYSINDLSKKWKETSMLGKTDKNLQAITTAINPNLGFKASSFLGCNFIPIALRPAQFTFKSKNGIISYVTRRKIEASNCDEYFFENQINILPLNELILCLDRNRIDNITKSKILLIDKTDYEEVLKDKVLIKKKEI